MSNVLFPSFLSILPVRRRGNCSCTFRTRKKREEVAQGKVTDSEPQTSLLHTRSGSGLGGEGGYASRKQVDPSSTME